MKTRILICIIISFFFITNLLKAQDCLPETRVDETEINKKIGKAIKFYFQDVEIDCFGKKKKTKGEYLRHTFLTPFTTKVNSKGLPARSAYVVAGAKTPSGCVTVILYVYQTGTGAEQYGDVIVRDASSGNHSISPEHKKYFNENGNCECINKVKNWLE